MKTKALNMNHKIGLYYIIFWSGIITILVLSHKANGILTDSNDLHCQHIQCPTKCPHDSYLKSSIDEDEEDFDDYEEELIHDPFIQELGHFEELPPELEIHDSHSSQHILKERQKREVFFQEDIERCCDEQKCVCNKCDEVPKCGEGQVAIEVHEGQGIPGNCCSVYRCVKKEECKLGVKQTWWTSKCKKCFCFGENELCTQICPEEETKHNCYSEYWGTMMTEAFWKEGRCTSCTCEEGEKRCFTPMCRHLECKNTVMLEDECCPKCADEDVEERTLIDHKKEEETENDQNCYSEFLQKSMKEGDSWEEENCISCSCEQGEMKCLAPVCAKLECKHTQIPEGKCCPICVEEESEEKPEIVHNKEEEIEEEFSTESTTIDIPIIKINELNATVVLGNQTSFPVIDDSLINETQTTSPIAEPEESATSLTIIEDISATLEPEIVDLLKGNSTLNEVTTMKSFPEASSVLEISSTPETSTEQSNSFNELEIDLLTNLFTSSTQQTPVEIVTEEELTVPTTTEEPKAKVIIDLYSTSTTEEIEIVSETTTEMRKELDSEETTSSDSIVTDSSQESSTETSTNYTEESSTLESSSTFSTTVTPLELSSSIIADSTLDINNISETTEASSTSFITSESIESSSTTEFVISSTKEPKEIISSTINTLLDSSTETSTEYFSTPTSHSNKKSHTISSSTSTTSSPFSSTNEASSSTESTQPEEIYLSSSTTSAPEPLKPLFQPYGRDLSSEARSSDTHNQMRIIFDEVDYVVMIVLFIGSMLCIALGLIIRHTKNRKKMYSSIPNSETSLSQTSTNTVLTV